MRQHPWFLLMMLMALSALGLNACSYSFQVLSTPMPPTAMTEQVPVPSTQAPFLTLVPSATPTHIPINADTIGRLTMARSFQLQEVVRGLAFTPDGTALAAAGGNTEDFAIHIWEVESGQNLAYLGGHSNIVWGLAFSPDGQLLASVSNDGTAQIRDWRSGDMLKVLNFPGPVVSVEFSPNGQTLAVGGVDAVQNNIQNAAVWTYAVASWSPVSKFPEFLDITAMAYAPGGEVLVGGGTSRNVQVWRTSDGSTLFTLNHAHQVSKAVISPDGSTVATATCAAFTNTDCTDGAVWLWDLPSGRLLQKLTGFPNMVDGLAFSVDGSSLITGSRDGTLRVYATAGYQPIFETAVPGGVETLAISHDGGWLATGGVNGEVNLWEIVSQP